MSVFTTWPSFDIKGFMVRTHNLLVTAHSENFPTGRRRYRQGFIVGLARSTSVGRAEPIDANIYYDLALKTLRLASIYALSAFRGGLRLACRNVLHGAADSTAVVPVLARTIRAAAAVHARSLSALNCSMCRTKSTKARSVLLLVQYLYRSSEQHVRIMCVSHCL